MSDDRKKRASRGYRPGIEALEALRLLAGLSTFPLGAPISVDATASTVPGLADSHFTTNDSAWDQALLDSRVADLLGGNQAPTQTISTSTSVDTSAIESGISQLDRYLSRAWYRAGIAPQAHEDCTQAVYASLLNTLGRDRFTSLVGEIGTSGIREVLSKETADGPDFFRAIDTVKKRAQREKSYQPIDSVDIPDSSTTNNSSADIRGALYEAINQSLNPREAELIHATLRGQTPAEIAQEWGVAPKTVSNEKSRAIQKLREVLVGADAGD